MSKIERTLLCVAALALVLSPGAFSEEYSSAKAPVQLASVENSVDESGIWWGNRCISFRNYIRFDRPEIALAEGPAKPYPPFKPIYFDLDKSVLRPDGIVICEQVLDFMTENPEKRVRVEGNCCDLASNPYNIALGQRRADAVKTYLVDHGIDASQIETASYGEERRVTTAPDERPLNRRADVIVKIEG